MTDYRRTKISGACYFFTVNCNLRLNNNILIENIDSLRYSFRKTKHRHPFQIDAIVILPEHIHCILTLPKDDFDYAKRWSLIKSEFSRMIPKNEKISQSRLKRGERGIWQRRFWEHLIRNEKDYSRHVDYIHWNPVKHGHVKRVSDWPYSSFHQFVKRGEYSRDWGWNNIDEKEYGEMR